MENRLIMPVSILKMMPSLGKMRVEDDLTVSFTDMCPTVATALSRDRDFRRVCDLNHITFSISGEVSVSRNSCVLKLVFPTLEQQELKKSMFNTSAYPMIP